MASLVTGRFDIARLAEPMTTSVMKRSSRRGVGASVSVSGLPHGDAARVMILWGHDNRE